ncbi:MAG TPA: HU family DNA-binding protein [Phycisphaerales bacterium]|nr:HU family DNA-binding protein [Phycisphaerales bacterium]
MNKGELIEQVASQMGESKTTATRIVDVVLKSIVDGVSKDQKVAIAGFGTFRKRNRKGRTGVNPSTKQEMVIKASSTIGFTPSQSLRDQV